MGKMVRLGDENLMDWFNSKSGRVVKKGTFGDKLTARECLQPARKTMIKKKVVKVKSFRQIIENKGFTRTRIIFSDKIIELLRIVDKQRVPKMYSTALGVVYVDNGAKNVSKYYAVS